MERERGYALKTKSCPFCGSDDGPYIQEISYPADRDGPGYTCYRVVCRVCGVMGPSADQKYLALTPWNRRSPSAGGV